MFWIFHIKLACFFEMYFFRLNYIETEYCCFSFTNYRRLNDGLTFETIFAYCSHNHNFSQKKFSVLKTLPFGEKELYLKKYFSTDYRLLYVFSFAFLVNTSTILLSLFEVLKYFRSHLHLGVNQNF